MFRNVRTTIAALAMLSALYLIPLSGCDRAQVTEMQKEIETLKVQFVQAQTENAQLKEQIATLNNIVQEMSKLHEMQSQEAEAAAKTETEKKPAKK